MALSGGGGCLLLLLLLFLATPHNSVTQEILVAPESRVVFLDQSAVFTCETVGGILAWIVNGTQREVHPAEIRTDLIVSEIITDDGTTLENLIIPARAEYNGTAVQCFVGIFGGSTAQSDNVTLTIQGPPSAVVNLSAVRSGSSFNISWSAPWSLNVTDVDHDIWYSVLIQNVTDEDRPTDILCTDCTNITETHYTFTPDHLSPCYVYNFTIIPANGAGLGEGVTLSYSFTVEGTENVVARLDGKCNVTYKVNELEHTLHVEYDDGVRNYEVVNGEAEFVLPPNKIYNVSFTFDPVCGKIEDNFTTFDVQRPKAEAIDGNITVTGELISGSHAIGCFIAIQCNIITTITFVALKRSEGDELSLSHNVPVPTSNYTVHAYDLEENALPHPHPANLEYVDMIIVTGSYQKPQSYKNPTNASISQVGSTVEVKCWADDDDGENENISCVVVYSAYGNSTLNVISNKTVSVNITLETGSYTFAIFRRINNSDIDEIPFITQFIAVEEPGTEPSLSPPKTPATDNPEASDGTGTVVGVVLSVVIIICVGVALVTVFIMWRKRKSRVKVLPPRSVVPSVSIHYCTRRCDVETGFDEQSSSRSSSGSSAVSDTPLLAEDGVVDLEGMKCVYAKLGGVSAGVRPPPAVDHTTVQYAGINIRATHKMATSPYADVDPPKTNRPTIDTAKAEFPYVHVKITKDKTKVKKTDMSVETTFQGGPPTVESVMSLLYGVASLWREIALSLGFDQDHLEDEIFVNSETDEARLQDCVEQWVAKLDPSWEQLSLVLRDLGQESLAQQACSGAKQPLSEPQQFSKPQKCSSDGDSSEESIVVSGLQREKAPTDSCVSDDTNNSNDSDEMRGDKKELHSDSWSSDEEVVAAWYHYCSLQEEAETPVVIWSNEDKSSLSYCSDSKTRAGKTCQNGLCFEEEAIPQYHTYWSPQGDDIISGCDVESCSETESEMSTIPTECSINLTPTECSIEGEKELQDASMTHVFTLCQIESLKERDCCFVFDSFPFSTGKSCFVAHRVITTSLMDDDINENAVSAQRAHQSSSTCLGRQQSTAHITQKVDGVGRDFVSGGVQVPSQHGTGFNGGHGGMEQETDRKSMSKKEHDDHCELCSVVECADRMAHCRRAIFPYLDFVARKGTLVIGKKRRDITNNCCRDEDEPLSDLPEPGCLSPPEETPPDSPSPQPTGPVPLETGQGYAPTPPQPDHHHDPKFSKEIFDSMSESEKTQFLDPPEIFKEKIVKWMAAGVALGYHGPDEFIKLCSGSSPIMW